jgi:hypothetical protein
MFFASLLLLAVFVLPAHAQTNEPEFLAEPAEGSSTAAEGGWFEIQAQPGDRVTQSLTLRNDSSAALDLRIAPVDATTGSRGGVSYALPEEPRERVGSWITLERDEVRLEPGAATDVAFHVDVSRDAPEGVNLAGVAVWAPADTAGTPTTAAGQAGAAIDVQTRRVVAVQINLPGPAAPVLTITGVEPVARPDGLYLQIGVENEGTGLTTATGSIAVADGSLTEDFAIDTFVPGTTIAYPMKWAEAADNGQYQAEVTIDYGVHSTAWEGSFALGPAVQAELDDRAVVDAGGPSPTLLAVGAALLAALAVGLGLLVGRRRPSARPRREAHLRTKPGSWSSGPPTPQRQT